MRSEAEDNKLFQIIGGRFSYVKSQEVLDRVIVLINGRKIVAIDTEFTRETTYYPILSIIQIALFSEPKSKEYFIIDCLSGLDLTGLLRIISDPEIVKIIHSSRQDLQIFYHQSGFFPRGIVDTQVMANLCGIGFNVGYSRLVLDFIGKELDKKQQRSDWQRRPLTAKQLEYALLDVTFLEEIYEKLLGILVKNNRLDWFLEEMDYFVKNSLVQSDESLFKNFSFRNKNAKQILQIKKLISCRDCWAKKVNVPRRHLLKDEVIEVVVRNSSGYDFSILKLDNLMVEEMRKILDEDVIVDDVETSLTMSPSDKDMCEVAKSFVRDYAKQIDLSEQFLMTSYDLRKSICNRDFFSEKVFGWRYELFGKELEKIIFNPDPSLELPRSCTKPKPC